MTNNRPKYINTKGHITKDLKFTNEQLEYLKGIFSIDYSNDISNDKLRVQLGEQRVLNHIKSIIDT